MDPPLEESFEVIRDELLSKHSFERTRLKLSEIGFLMGNAEIGGLANHFGTGLKYLWLSDLWEDEKSRLPLTSPVIECADFFGHPTIYRQTLSLIDGVLRTRVIFDDQVGYESTICCSYDTKPLLLVQIQSLDLKKTRTWKVILPTVGFETTQESSRLVRGITKDESFTSVAWSTYCNKPLLPEENVGHRRYFVDLGPNETLSIRFAVATHWSGQDFKEQSYLALRKEHSPDELLVAHKRVFKDAWRQTAVVILPDKGYERLFYRSVFWLLCTSGSKMFLPGEAQFAVGNAWDMHPFTYGAAGWAIHAFVSLGLADHAHNMIEAHFKPDALQKNAELFLEKHQQNPDVWCFAHEQTTEGLNLHVIGDYFTQRHVDGFAGSFFHRFSRHYPNFEFIRTRTYPVLRGLAEFWSRFVLWDKRLKRYTIPKVLSVSEDLFEESVLDAVLTAKWVLMMAARYSEELEQDSEIREKWLNIAKKLFVPQSKKHYMESLVDRGDRSSSGYNGIRAPLYLGFPTMELIPVMDKAKVGRTLDNTWLRNEKGAGMIAFVANWFSLANVYYGRGDQALEVLGRNLECFPEALAEVGTTNPYFLTSYAAYTIVPISMVVQSYDDRISIFPAVPEDWKNVSFYNVPVEGGIRVSGEMKDGNLRWVSCSKDGEELYRSTDAVHLKINRDGKKVSLMEEKNIVSID